MTDEASAPDPADQAVLEVYEEATDRPIAGGRWEILVDDTVRYRRPDGTVESPAVVSAATLRSSPTWRRVS